MNLKNYFADLPNRLSANLFAMLGFVNIMFPTVGTISTYIQIIANNNSTPIKDIPIIFLSIIVCFIPITCLLAIIPIIVLFKFLVKPQFQIKTQIFILLFTVFICVNPFISTFNYNNGGGIFFAFVPIYGLPVALLALGIYFILLLLDLANKTNIKNEALVKNVYYKKFVNIFYWYFLFLNLLFFGIFICYILLS